MKDNFIAGVYIVLLIAAVLTLITLVAYPINAYMCRAEWGESGMEYKVSFPRTCLVKKDGVWYPSKNLRLLD